MTRQIRVLSVPLLNTYQGTMNYTEILLAIAPVFLLILFGYGLRRADFPGGDFWERSNKLVYWVLFPALLFSSTSTISFSGDAVLTYAVVIYSGFGSAVIFALLAGKLLGIGGPLSTSVLQGSARHNTFYCPGRGGASAG
jgi:malonate transporter